jgi:transcription initiation factor IIE alpha subunit
MAKKVFVYVCGGGCKSKVVTARPGVFTCEKCGETMTEQTE